MPRELIESPDLYSGVPYSYAAVSPPGSAVFTAGACPLDTGGELVGPGDIEAQTRQTLENLLRALDAAGCGVRDVVKTTVYVATTNPEHLAACWRVVEKVFGEKGPPSTLLGVTALGWPGQLVEIEAVAARGE